MVYAAVPGQSWFWMLGLRLGGKRLFRWGEGAWKGVRGNRLQRFRFNTLLVAYAV